ncbi:RNA-directed DNA polymerase, eukaryota [Tanacetum coccineum]
MPRLIAPPHYYSFAPQLHESAGGLPKTKLVSHSCSLAGSTSAMEVSIPIAFVLPDREHECNENDASLPDASISTRWCRFIPKKVNIFVWRAICDRLPTRWNLSIKGFELESIICPNCSSSPETVQHSLWACIHTTCVWHKVFTWLDLPYTSPASLHDVYAYVDQLHFQKDRKLMLEAIFGVVLWTLWSFRNNLIFSNVHSARNEIFDKITSTSFLWYTNRNRKANISWMRWMQNPLIPSVL